MIMVLESERLETAPITPDIKFQMARVKTLTERDWKPRLRSDISPAQQKSAISPARQRDILFACVKFAEIGAEACRSRETVPVMRILWKRRLAAAPEPSHQPRIRAAPFYLIKCRGV